MHEIDISKLIIIGSGPAGLTAAIYASRALLDPIVIEGRNPGGQLINTSYVENWPGQKSILGVNLMKDLKDHALVFNTKFIQEEVISVDFSQRPFTINTNRATLKSHSVIIATGASPNRLNCPGESQYWSKGVTTCAVCDGAFYPNKKVVILGGGDTAMEDALFMTKYTDDITIIHILEKFTASPIMQKRVLDNQKIKKIYSSTIIEIKGDDSKATSVVVENLITKDTFLLESDVLFLAIGQRPNTNPFKDNIELDQYGYIKVTNNTNTSVGGVFCAGDVCDLKYRQAITSAASGCMALLNAQRFLEENGI